MKEVTIVNDKATVDALASVKEDAFNVVVNVATNEEATQEMIDNGTISKETAEAIKEAVSAGEIVEAIILVEELTNVDAKIKDAIVKEAVSILGKDAKVQYLDISVLLTSKTAGVSLGELHKLSKPITITVAIPKDMQNKDAEYVVIRNHDGKVDTLKTVNNGDGTISFTTDQFSTYAIAFVAKAPETGDSTNVAMLLAMLIASAYVLIRKRA